jgi:5-hydroxyisourate hydrolase
MAGLTTHVLDTASGKPAAGIQIDFAVLEGDTYRPIKTVHTNADGRNDQPLLMADTMRTGRYQLVFHLGAYFSKLGISLPDPSFLDKVTVQFGISDVTQHYHVPLLASPWSYTTYRGS